MASWIFTDQLGMFSGAKKLIWDDSNWLEIYKLSSTPAVVPILYIPSSDRCNTTPATLKGSAGDLLSTNGISRESFPQLHLI